MQYSLDILHFLCEKVSQRIIAENSADKKMVAVDKASIHAFCRVKNRLAR